MAEAGEEKLIAMARHIAKTLGHNDSMADDILQIFSNFDGRFSREKLADDIINSADVDHRGPPPIGAGAFSALDHTLKSLERQIGQYISASHPIWSDSADSSAFLDSVDALVSTVRRWSPLASTDKSLSACLSRADELLQQAMFRLADEFRLLMEHAVVSESETTGNLSSDDEDGDDYDQGDIPVAQPLIDYDVVIDALPSGTVNDLHEIAKRMVGAGFVRECSHVYGSCRREFLEESISRLGLQKLSIEEVQKMTWPNLEDEIDKWTKASTVCLRILFPSERRLCDRVFFGISSAADLSFMEVCRGTAIQILTFADAVAIGSRSPERLFKVLDLFETMRDLMPEFEGNFSDPYCLVLRNDAVSIWKRLGEAIRGIFMELENLIRRDPVKGPVPGGDLHPITRYVMNYLRAACRSRETLELVFDESAGASVNVVGSKEAAASSLSVQMAWIMELLESNLEMKSKVYGDPALSSVFMMNSGRYILHKVKDSDLGSLLGDDWMRKHSAKLKQLRLSYQRASWNKVLGVLRTDNSSLNANAGGMPLSMKEKILLFNVYFEELCKTQSPWVIFDEQQRSDLLAFLVNLLVPAYGNFIGRFRSSAEVGKHADKFIKYSREDIEVKISELFRGGSGSAGSRK